MDIYYDRINGVLKNKLNIQDNKELDTVEYILTAYRLAQLGERDIKRALTMDDYKEIHRHIFQDIYEWAGEYRKVNLQKDKTNFLPFTFLNNAEKELNKSISSYLYSASDSKLFVCKKLGKILCDLNYMHPFREGNGRAQREFIRQLAYLKGYELAISSNNELYMEGCIKDDPNIMYKALEREIVRQSYDEGLFN